MENKKANPGGTRPGSGAKPKYNERTVTVGFRCPESKVTELRRIVNNELDKWKVKK